MAGEWPLVPLGEISDLFDGPHQTAPQTEDGPIVYLNVGDIRGGRIELRNSGRVTDETAASWSRRVVPQAGDIVFGYEATLGHAALLSADYRWCLGRRVGLLRPRQEVVAPRFLTYSWYSPRFQETLRSNRVGGTTIESVRLTDLPSWSIALPPLAEQRAIAHILGTLDDKIELNRRTNETLEAIARALFKSWFVDFDPVRAKSEGRDPGLPPHLVDLFPDSFEDSELGEIPKGWRVMAIADLADVNARTLGRTDRLDVIDYVEISEVTRGQVANVVRYERGTEPSRARRRLVHGDTVISTVRPDRGSYFLSLSPPEALIVSTGFAVASPRDGNWAFLYSALTRPEVGDELGRLADGGAYPAVRPEAVTGFRLVSPQAGETRTAYDELARPLYERSEHNRIENRLLASMRDTLLPKLMSGELRPNDADRIIEAAPA